MHRHAWPNNAHRARIEDAGRDQMDSEAALLVDHCMSSVGAAVATDNQVRVSGQQVDDLAFALVTPMAADHSRYRHVPNFSVFSARMRTDLRSSGRNRPGGAR